MSKATVTPLHPGKLTTGRYLFALVNLGGQFRLETIEVTSTPRPSDKKPGRWVVEVHFHNRSVSLELAAPGSIHEDSISALFAETPRNVRELSRIEEKQDIDGFLTIIKPDRDAYDLLRHHGLTKRKPRRRTLEKTD